MKNKRTKVSILCLAVVVITSAVFIYKDIEGKNAVIVQKSKEIKNIDKTIAERRGERDKLLSMLDPKDSNTIFNVVDAIQADQNLSHNCHDIAHDFGHRSFELYGFLPAMTFNNPNHLKHTLVEKICAGGYLHGVLEELSLHNPDFINNPEIVCDTLPSADQSSCYHGIGHVIMINNDRDVAQSISGCRVIKNLNFVYRCFEGVRMEQFWGNAEYIGSSTLSFNPDRPLDSCITAIEDERPTCFLYTTFGYLSVHNRDYRGAAILCTQSDLTESDRHFCLKGLGMTMMSKFRGENMQGSEVYVDGLSTNEKFAFYEGVLGYSDLSGLSQDKLKSTCSLLKNDSLICEDVLLQIK